MSEQDQKKTWQDLEHKLWAVLRAQKIEKQKILLACSGGADSQALMHLLSQFSPLLQLELGVMTVHHGGASAFRKKSLEFCKQEAKKLGLPFYSEKSAIELKSEKAMRDFRYAAFRKCAAREKYSLIATAHHADDLLETRVLRLIRGVGPKGLRSIESRKGDLLRPFLEISKAELTDWLTINKIQFCDDPSNQDVRYLRNWVRREWLPLLEQKKPGSLGSLARSLGLLSRTEKQFQLQPYLSSLTEGGIDRGEYVKQSSFLQKQILFHYCQSRGCAQISTGQIEEIRKRLDRRQKVHTFSVAGLVWQVNAGQILAKKNHKNNVL